MNTTEYVTGITVSSNASKILRSYERIYRGFPVLDYNLTSSRPSHRIITYRGVRGAFSNVKPERRVLSYQVIYRGFPLNAMAA